MKINIRDKFSLELPADSDTTNNRRQVEKACYSFVNPKIPSSPKLVHFSPDMASRLGISEKQARSDHFLNIFSGAELIDCLLYTSPSPRDS